MTQLLSRSLPDIIAGPMLRHTDQHQIVWWMVTSVPHNIKPALFNEKLEIVDQKNGSVEQNTFCIGRHAYIQLVTLKTKNDDAFIEPGALYYYDLLADDESSLLQNIEELTYEGHNLPNFRFKQHLSKVAHGSCRKPHFRGQDALPQLDNLVAQELAQQASNQQSHRPDLMLMTGDQVYIDDVAGPTLHAIHQVIELLGLHGEEFEGATVDSLHELMSHEHSFYQRNLLLPEVEANDKLSKAFFKAKRKPIFTSVNAKNHLIALSEMLAMYLLTWSPTLWKHISLDKVDVSNEQAALYEAEKTSIMAFKEGLAKVRRALAHVPIYMIFDDHDVTDDWNLTRGWEEQIYGNPFSKRIIGNAMTAYFLCQGCGNPREKLSPLFSHFHKVFSGETSANQIYAHQTLIDTLLDFDQWHYELATQPPVHVLDTRTQRWRSESSLNKPSGLMDWEALCELQQSIIGKESVIMVSAAPVYGVKFIETVQRVFTMFGGALVVDAENWMAHRGTASVMLNIFRHMKTPPNFIILSGDVHYSFVYDVSLRFRRNSPHITQFTSSGLHNEFPEGLLRWFDRLNRWFYGHRSPLNWLTKRRNMSVKQRQPSNQSGTLVNSSNIGVVNLNEDASQVDCALLCSDGSYVNFSKAKKQLQAEARAREKDEAHTKAEQ